MSASAKETQPLGSRSGKRGYTRTCVRCGITLYGVGCRTKYCPECRRITAIEKALERERLERERLERERLERERLERERAKHPPTGPDVREAAAQADAAGMTYGLWRAKQEGRLK